MEQRDFVGAGPDRHDRRPATRAHDDHKENLTFTHLDLEIPPVPNKSGWVEALRLMRLIRARSGVIAGNILRGGTIEFFEGPWRIVDNDFAARFPGHSRTGSSRGMAPTTWS